jgi:signal transduction histidine kinase
MPLMIGINASFWILYGGVGISIGLALLLTISLMLLLVLRGSQTFRSSILMRYEKDQLLARLAAEKEKTEAALKEAQTANYARGYFMAAAKHDIKQPLHALALITDTLLMSRPVESHIPLLKQLRSSITQMSDHFDALMDMRSFLSGQFEVNVTRFRLGDFRARIDSEIAPACAAKGLSWSLDMEDVPVSTDEELLLRLLRNLLLNAVRYTERGEVSCSARAEGNVVKFLITDTGMGIASEFQEHVFEDFVRLAYERQEPTGSGLGLSIVKKINQALQLNLQMSSIPGKGTQFSFWLPMADTP